MQYFSKFYISNYEFSLDTLEARFYYSFDKKIYFTEKINFNIPDMKPISEYSELIFRNILFSISIASAISYYKLFPTEEIVVEYGYLDNNQIKFWQDFYVHGLGEFFYKNKITLNKLEFINTQRSSHSNLKFICRGNNILLPIGGGKDSIVSIELLKKLNYNINLLTIGSDYPLHQEVANISGLPRITISKQLDPLLFEMNKQGYYNGHVPISGILSFIMIGLAYLYNYKYIVFSNEKSANYGNVVREDRTINHQYCKSLEFERNMHNYIIEYISADLKYFSLLRGMYEIQIAKLFSQYKQYFAAFSSCNNNFKLLAINKVTNKRWCGICPKCAFVFAILRPYLSDQEVINIFGTDLYTHNNLENLFGQLLGIYEIKPFECVGRPEEVILSMYKMVQWYEWKNQPLPYILNFFHQKIGINLSDQAILNLESELFYIYPHELIPEKFLGEFNKVMK